MQDSGRAPGAPSGYSRCALRPRRRPSTEHSPESQKQPAASQSGFIAACPPAPESPIRLPSPPRGRGRLLLGKMVKARGLITSIPGAKRAGKHGTAGFGSSAPADALRQFGRQPLRAPLLKPNDWPLPPSHPPGRRRGTGGKEVSILWSGLAMASITSSASLSTAWQPDIQIQSVVLGYQRDQDATLTPSWLPETG